MNLLEVIRRADEARPNSFDGETKSRWLFELEGEFAELMGAEDPVNPFPEDCTLLMPYPHDGCYELYLYAKIDNANQETDLYQNDYITANNSISAAKAWWRRRHNPNSKARVKLPCFSR